MMRLSDDRRVELLEYLEDLRFAAGCIYRLRMNVNYDELPSPSRTALRISRLEQRIIKLERDLKTAWAK